MFLFAGRVPANKFLFAGRVPANKFLLAGRVPANNLFQFFLTHKISNYSKHREKMKQKAIIYQPLKSQFSNVGQWLANLKHLRFSKKIWDLRIFLYKKYLLNNKFFINIFLTTLFLLIILKFKQSKTISIDFDTIERNLVLRVGGLVVLG